MSINPRPYQRDAFKQTKGLFLTHPNIVLFILAALDVGEAVTETLRSPPEDRRYRLPYVIDPSCGTGTFLIHYMQYVQKYIEENCTAIALGDNDVTDFINRHVMNDHAYKWVIDYVYGIDQEPVLATACQINLILHGDGSTNIYNTDGLASFSSYADKSIVGSMNMLGTDICDGTEHYPKNSLGKFDFIISNPPFNVKLNKQRYADNYIVTGKSEAYFLERWYQLLKPKGRIGVVLPESFFAVEEDVNARVFLYKHFNIKAIVSLPSHAFLPHTPTNTSLLFAEKKSLAEEAVFVRKYQAASGEFDQKLGEIYALLPASKKDVSFDGLDQELPQMPDLLTEVERKCHDLFGQGFIVLPYFKQHELSEIAYGATKKKIKDTLNNVKERWVLHRVSTEIPNEFLSFTTEEIGYKAGKKGAKDRPNDLMSIYTARDQKLFNLKYAHSWHRIDEQDETTVLGMVKELKIWQ